MLTRNDLNQLPATLMLRAEDNTILNRITSVYCLKVTFVFSLISRR